MRDQSSGRVLRSEDAPTAHRKRSDLDACKAVVRERRRVEHGDLRGAATETEAFTQHVQTRAEQRDAVHAEVDGRRRFERAHHRCTTPTIHHSRDHQHPT